MGCGELISGSSTVKNQLKGRTEEQQKAILYFTNGTGGCLGKKACTDAEYDAMVQAKLSNIATQQQALEKLGIDIDQVKEIAPVCLKGYYNFTKQRSKRGTDGILRSAGYRVTWLFFSSSQVYVYQYAFATDEEAKKVNTEEYFYRDITNFATKSESIEYISGYTGGGCGKEATPQYSTGDVEFFRLVVSGDSFQASMTPSDETTKSIRAMQQKLREKKGG